MSMPMEKHKKDAQRYLPNYQLQRVYVKIRDGFLQAPKGGKFWLPIKLAEEHDLKSV